MVTDQVEELRRHSGVLIDRGLLVAAQEELTKLLALVEPSGDPTLMIPALNGLAVVALRQREVDKAYQLVHRALGYAESADTPKSERLRVYLNLTILLTEMGRLDDALEWAIRSAGLGGGGEEALSLTHWLNLSNLHWRRQEWVPMLNAANEAHRLAQATENKSMGARALTNLGIASLELGLHAEAEQQFSRALTLAAGSDPEVVAHVNAEQGRLRFLKGEYNEALEAGRSALDALVTGVSVYDKEIVASVSWLFGSVFGTYGERNLALKYLNRAAAYYSQMGRRAEWQRATDAIGQLLTGPHKRLHGPLQEEMQRLDFLTAVLDMTDDLESVDPILRDHSERTATLAVLLGESIGLDPTRLRLLGLSAWLHDVGKVAVDVDLLHRSTPLSAAEEARVAMHATMGEEMLRPYGFPPDGLAGIRHHHENFDGTGIPDGLAKEEIPVLARIIAVVDRYDELTSNLGGRPGLDHGAAVARLQAMAGRELDPTLVQEFLGLYNA